MCEYCKETFLESLLSATIHNIQRVQSRCLCSLVPRPLPTRGEGPGTHRLRMREQNTLLPRFAIFVVAIISVPWRAVKLFAYLMASIICRVCAGKAERPHYTAIFSKESLQVGLPGRLSSMLGIPVVQNDSCPQRICRACMRKFTSVETHIKQLQQTAQTTYHKFIDGPSSRKRTRHQWYCRSVTSNATCLTC